MWLLVQIVAENGIVVIDELTKMGVHNKRLVGCAEVSFSCQFESDHLELVSGGCSCRVNVEVDILNVDDNEFTQSISRTDCCHLLLMLVVSRPVKFKCTHRVDIYHVHGCGDLVNQEKWANAAKTFRCLWFHYDQVISAHRCQLKNIRVLEMIGVVLFIV